MEFQTISLEHGMEFPSHLMLVGVSSRRTRVSHQLWLHCRFEARLERRVFCSGLLSIAVIHQDQKHLGDERLISAYSFNPSGKTSQGKDWRQELGVRNRSRVYGEILLFTDLLLLGCLVFFLHLRTVCSWMSPPTLGWVLLHQSLTKKMPHVLPIGQAGGNIFEVEVSSSQMSVILYQFVKTNQHRERVTNGQHTKYKRLSV